MSREATEMAVESVTVEVSDVKTIRLKWPDGYNPEFKTGQFITCYWPDEPGVPDQVHPGFSLGCVQVQVLLKRVKGF